MEMKDANQSLNLGTFGCYKMLHMPLKCYSYMNFIIRFHFGTSLMLLGCGGLYGLYIIALFSEHFYLTTDGLKNKILL